MAPSSMEMEHDHSAHANTTEAAALPAHPAHGTLEGHILPGSFFLIWSTWWLVSIFRYSQLCSYVANVLSGVAHIPRVVKMQASAQGQLQSPFHLQELV